LIRKNLKLPSMKAFDFVIIGGGIAGLLSAYFLRDKNTLLIDKDGILSGASGAAGAFLFPKVGFDTAYTRFINSAILEAIKFYESLSINPHKKGVLILPRDERDIEKFKKYEKEIKIPFEKREGGFFFKEGCVIDPDEVRKTIKVNFERVRAIDLKKEDYWIINGEIKTKNVILATGYEEIIDLKYIKIRPVWGERIEIKTDLKLPHYYHKNCSLGEIEGIVKIGATHKRNCLDCQENEEEAKELIEKANEIAKIEKYEILDVKGGHRAASVDFFPVVGEVIDIERTLEFHPKVVKGERPKKIFYKEGLYIINGMGGRGFSNAYVCAKMLKEFIETKKDLGILDSKRLFIKWARKEGEEYLRRRNVKG